MTGPPRTPRWILLTALAAFFGTALFGFVLYNFCRTRSGPLERGLGECLAAAARAGLAVGIMLAFLMLPVLAAHEHLCVRRPRWRLARGRCPRCDYPLAAGAPCPECGQADLRAPEPRSVRLRLGVAVILAWFLAALAAMAGGEAMIRADERAFVREVQAAAPEAVYWRNRRWPNGACELIYDPDRGYWTVDD
jgi:hypothetical protein